MAKRAKYYAHLWFGIYSRLTMYDVSSLCKLLYSIHSSYTVNIPIYINHGTHDTLGTEGSILCWYVPGTLGGGWPFLIERHAYKVARRSIVTYVSYTIRIKESFSLCRIVHDAAANLFSVSPNKLWVKKL